MVPGRPYAALAECYDELFGGMRGPGVLARKHVLGRILPKVKAACDIACGTGDTAVDLARAGIRMFASDLSPEMCRLTSRKARGAGVPVKVLCADMRDFRLPGPVDLLLCEFDAINHVPRKSDLRRVARCAARALRPGGHFYFDANNRLELKELWPKTFWFEQPRIAMAMHGGWNSKRELGWLEVEIFRLKGRLWSRTTERVEEVCWSEAEVRETLRSAGFTKIRAFDAAPFYGAKSAMRPGYRTHYLARVG